MSTPFSVYRLNLNFRTSALAQGAGLFYCILYQKIITKLFKKAMMQAWPHWDLPTPKVELNLSKFS
jgi:hypothetical protein